MTAERASQRAPVRRRHRLAAALAVAASLVTGPPLVSPPAAAAAPGDATATVDPGATGPNAVEELRYDLGAEAFQPDGFPGRVELEGAIYAPRTISGRAPVVILLHGRHVTCASDTDADLRWPCPAGLPEVPSYLGYGVLGRNLASHGYVVVSIGANGVNAVDGFLADGGAAARAQLVLEHLRRLRAWDEGSAGSAFSSRFAGHLDLGRVGLMGHSRGGEGVVAAAQLNQRIGSPFGIRAVLALAPVDFGRRVLAGVPLGVVLPYCDGDVSDLQGASYYDDARYASPGDPAPKMTALLYGANHNFFNSVWTTGPGSGDDTEFFGPIDEEPRAAGATDPCASGSAHRLSPTVQEQAGAVLVGGFLRRHVGGEVGLTRFVTGTAPVPASAGVARWAVAHHEPDRLDIARFDAADQARVNRFGGLASLTGLPSTLVCDASSTEIGEVTAPSQGSATPCPGAAMLRATNVTGVLDVAWRGRATVVREPLHPSGVDVRRFDGVRLRVAVTDDARNATRDRQDLRVVLEDRRGRRAAVAVGDRTGALVRVNQGQVGHALLNGIRLPLAEFRGVDLSAIRAVELRFDRTPAGRVSVADLAFTREGTGSAVGTPDTAPLLPRTRTGCLSSEATRWSCAVAQVVWGRDPLEDEQVLLAAAHRSAADRRAMVRALVAGDEARTVRLAAHVQRFAQVELAPEQLPLYFAPDAPAPSWREGVVVLTGAFSFTSARVASTRQVVDAAYQTIAGRSPSSAEVAAWSSRVERVGTEPLARALVATTTARRLVVDGRFAQIVGRAPSAAERDRWVARLAGPRGEEELVVDLLGSEAFRRASTS